MHSAWAGDVSEMDDNLLSLPNGNNIKIVCGQRIVSEMDGNLKIQAMISKLFEIAISSL